MFSRFLEILQEPRLHLLGTCLTKKRNRTTTPPPSLLLLLRIVYLHDKTVAGFLVATVSFLLRSRRFATDNPLLRGLLASQFGVDPWPWNSVQYWKIIERLTDSFRYGTSSHPTESTPWFQCFGSLHGQSFVLKSEHIDCRNMQKNLNSKKCCKNSSILCSRISGPKMTRRRGSLSGQSCTLHKLIK